MKEDFFGPWMEEAFKATGEKKNVKSSLYILGTGTFFSVMVIVLIVLSFGNTQG